MAVCGRVGCVGGRGRWGGGGGGGGGGVPDLAGSGGRNCHSKHLPTCRSNSKTFLQRC